MIRIGNSIVTGTRYGPLVDCLDRQTLDQTRAAFLERDMRVIRQLQPSSLGADLHRIADADHFSVVRREIDQKPRMFAGDDALRAFGEPRS